MSQENQVVMKSTTTHGYLYVVYKKEDIERKKIIYTGEISDDEKYSYCECVGWALREKCYHQTLAKETMEVKIIG